MLDDAICVAIRKEGFCETPSGNDRFRGTLQLVVACRGIYAYVPERADGTQRTALPSGPAGVGYRRDHRVQNRLF
jgi:hypothetical protein